MHCVFHKKIVVKWLFTFYFMLFTFLGGCAATGTNTTYGDDDSKCGIYPPPPANFIRKRIAIIPLKDKTNQQYTKTDLGSQAVDIGITLLLNAERFDVVERERLDALLAEQKLVGIVDPATAAKAGKISQPALLGGLRVFLKLLHPFVPFVTEAVWQQLPPTKEPLLINSQWPQ